MLLEWVSPLFWLTTGKSITSNLIITMPGGGANPECICSVPPCLHKSDSDSLIETSECGPKIGEFYCRPSNSARRPSNSTRRPSNSTRRSSNSTRRSSNSIVGRRILHVGRRILHVGRRTLRVGRRILHVGRRTLHVGRRILLSAFELYWRSSNIDKGYI